MNNTLRIPALATAIASPLLLASGNALPLLKSSLGYGYVSLNYFAGAAYLLAVMLLVINVMADKLRQDVASGVYIIAALVTIGMLVYCVSAMNDGIQYFRYQTALDMPSWDRTNQDAFWSSLASFNTIGVDLREAYTAFGPGVTFNGTPVYQNVINSLDHDQVLQLIRTGGVSYFWYPFGSLGFATAAALQARLMVQALRKREPASPAIA